MLETCRYYGSKVIEKSIVTLLKKTEQNKDAKKLELVKSKNCFSGNKFSTNCNFFF